MPRNRGEEDAAMLLPLSLPQIRAALEPVFRRYAVRRAVLFGSYAKGCATEKSDIDILVDTDLRGLRLMELFCAVQDALGGMDLDLFARYELIPGGRADEEIRRTGKEIYRA